MQKCFPYQILYRISHRLLLIIGAAACLFMLALEGEVVADDAAGLGAVLVVQHRSVCKMTQRRKLLLHIQDVAICVNALRRARFSFCSRQRNVSRFVCLCQIFSHRVQVQEVQSCASTGDVRRHQVPFVGQCIDKAICPAAMNLQ